MIRAFFILFFVVFELFATEYDSVEFKGNKAFFTSVLYGVAGIDNYSNVIKLQKDKNITIGDVEQVRENLIDFYQSKGYYKCEVNYEVSGKKLLFIIDESDPVKISKININSPLKLKQFMTLSVGDVFDADKFVEMKHLIRRYMDENGYPKAKMHSSAMIYIDDYKAEIDLNVTRFVKSKIARIITPQMPRISREAIKNKLTFKEGDVFDIREIEKSRENLYMTDMFYSVKLEVDKDSEDDNVTIRVELESGKDRTLKAALGYTSDYGPRVKFSWINKNMFDDFRRFETSLNFTKDSQSADVALFVPNVYGFPFEDRVSLTQDRFDYLGYSEAQLSNTFRFSKDILNAKQYVGLKTEKGEVSAQTPSEYIKSQQYVTNAVLYEFLLDQRDSKLDASSGYLIDANVEFANHIFASSLNYVKIQADARKIYTPSKSSLFSDFTFALKGTVGVIDDLQQQSYIPIFKRFFAGGSFSNRGYQYKKMGPHDASGNYIGAKTMIDASSELRYRVTQKFATVLFYDTTLLDYKSFDFAGQYKPSIGIGARYETGVGPIRLDVGVPLLEDKRSPVFHISFGQAF